METVYRRALENLQTREWTDGAFRSLIDGWFFGLEEVVLEAGRVDPNHTDAVAEAVGQLLEQRLATVSATHPQFAAALRACHTARVRGDHATAEGLIAWLMGQPNVGAGIKRAANLKGEIDHTLAGGFLRGVLEVLRQSGEKGLVLVLDEVETIQRVRTDSRERSLDALRKLIHRGDTAPNCTFLATSSASLLQAAAILDLHARGYVEPVRPSAQAFHIYAHQAMALAVQTAGIVRKEV